MASPSGFGFSEQGSWLLRGSRLKGSALRGRVTIGPCRSCVAFSDLASKIIFKIMNMLQSLAQIQEEGN